MDNRMISFPLFPKGSVIVVSIPRNAPEPDYKSVDFSNLLASRPCLVAFCGYSAEDWEEVFDYYIIFHEIDTGSEIETILTISDRIKLINEKHALKFIEPLTGPQENPIVIYYPITVL